MLVTLTAIFLLDSYSTLLKVYVSFLHHAFHIFIVHYSSQHPSAQTPSETNISVETELRRPSNASSGTMADEFEEHEPMDHNFEAIPNQVSADDKTISSKKKGKRPMRTKV